MNWSILATISLVLLVVPAGARTASAQAAPGSAASDQVASAPAVTAPAVEDRGRPYAGVGLIVNSEYTEISFGAVPRSSVGVRASVGTFLTPRVLVALEIDVPAELARRDVTYRDQGVIDNTETTRRSLTEAVLVGFRRRPRARTGFTIWGGAGFFQVQHGVTTATTSPLAPARTTSYGIGAYHSTGIVVGLDADLAISRHLSVVPFFRTYAVTEFMNGTTILRSGASFRWQF